VMVTTYCSLTQTMALPPTILVFIKSVVNKDLRMDKGF
jgi:hypothetical protein